MGASLLPLTSSLLQRSLTFSSRSDLVVCLLLRSTALARLMLPLTSPSCALLLLCFAVLRSSFPLLRCFRNSHLPPALNSSPASCFAVLRSSSPLVRHLSVVAEPATGLAPTRRSRATVFRARRAWLPPSALWLFRPRNYDHDIGEEVLWQQLGGLGKLGGARGS